MRGEQIREPEAFLVRTALRLYSNAKRYARRHPYVDQAVEDLALLDTSPLPVFPGETHATAWTLAFNHGLKTLLGPAVERPFWLEPVK